MIETVDGVIEELGGNAAVAALTGTGSPAVSNWRSRGRIPSKLAFVIAGALAAKGKQAAPAVFGMSDAAGAVA